MTESNCTAVPHVGEFYIPPQQKSHRVKFTPRIPNCSTRRQTKSSSATLPVLPVSTQSLATRDETTLFSKFGLLGPPVYAKSNALLTTSATYSSKPTAFQRQASVPSTGVWSITPTTCPVQQHSKRSFQAVCNLCGENVGDITFHVRNNHKTCYTCHVSGFSVSTLKAHNRTGSLCPICRRWVCALQQHLSSAHPGFHPCGSCSEYVLDDAVHQAERHWCNVCNIFVHSIFGHRRHVHTFHPGEHHSKHCVRTLKCPYHADVKLTRSEIAACSGCRYTFCVPSRYAHALFAQST